MDDFLSAFFDVFLYPVNPEFLSFEDNPVMLLLCMVLIGMGITGIVRRFFFAVVGFH